MEFLKSIFGNKAMTFDEFVNAVNAHNGNEENKGNQIKIGNLGSGEYVGKGKHDALQALFDGQKTELEKANGLIAELQKGTKGNEELQGKINAYTKQVEELQTQLQAQKIESALKLALLSEKAIDVPYMSFKINEKLKGEGKTLELDENENIKGWDDMLSGLKTQFPTMFESAKQKQVDPNHLPKGDERQGGVSKDEFAKMGYQSRLKIKQEQPELYAELTGKTV